MSLRRHLVVSFVLFAFAILVATLVPFGVLSSSAHRSSYIEQQRNEAQEVAVSLGKEPHSGQTIADRYGGTTVAAWLLDEHGTPLGEPSYRQAFPAFATEAAEIEHARGGDTASRVGTSPIGSRVFVAVPVIRQGRIEGVLWVSASLAPVDTLSTQRWAILAAIGALAMLAAAVVGMTLARRLTRRLETVAAGAKRFGEGRLDETIPVEGTDEIATLAARLNDMASEIDRLVQREKGFVAAASHQIRTPLAAIKIRIDELLMEGDRRSPSGIEYLKEMAEEVDRLTGLTTRLLDLSSAERAPERRPLVASRAIREAVDRVAPLAEHNSIAVRVTIENEDVVIQAPTGSFEEGLFNLLDNAVKFSRPGNEVDVRAQLDNGSLIVEVADRGPGIPPEQRLRVLDPFHRGSHSKPGYGLGLAISTRLLQAAGATLGIDPRPGGGTVASIRWPMSQTEN